MGHAAIFIVNKSKKGTSQREVNEIITIIYKLSALVDNYLSDGNYFTLA